MELVEKRELFQFLDGSCPYCRGEVGIIEGLVNEYTLGQDGIPNRILSESYKIVGYCDHCKKALLVLPNNGRYIVYPEGVALSAMQYGNVETHMRAMEIELLEKKDENPFVAQIDDDELPF